MTVLPFNASMAVIQSMRSVYLTKADDLLSFVIRSRRRFNESIAPNGAKIIRTSSSTAVLGIPLTYNVVSGVQDEKNEKKEMEKELSLVMPE